jgi:glycosyltransferase 2 family protein
MKNLKLLFLFLGLILLGFIIQEADLKEVWRHVTEVGWGGMAFVLGFYILAFVTDVASWQLTFETIPLKPRWLGRLYLIRTVGEAFNNVIPLASLGGEPIKAWMLNSYYGIEYCESIASLVLAKTITLIGLVLFLSAGFVLVVNSSELPSAYKTVAGLGLVGFNIAIILFFLVQRFQIASWVGRFLGNSRAAHRIEDLVALIRAVDERLLEFYTLHHKRFWAALLLSSSNWLSGVIEIYCIMYLLGHPITFTDAWIIEAMAQLVRAGTFFIPSSIGAQEATFTVVCSAITGTPSLGLAALVIRRSREIVWILTGLGIWWRYSLQPGFSGAHEQTLG